MRVAVKSHALPVNKKNRIALLLCTFETTISLYLRQYFVYTSSEMSLGIYADSSTLSLLKNAKGAQVSCAGPYKLNACRKILKKIVCTYMPQCVKILGIKYYLNQMFDTLD